MSKSESKAVAPKVEKPLVAASDAFLNFSGAGFENVTARDMIVPRLAILQGLSPQVQPRKPEYIQGAKVGDICDVGTGEIFDAPLVFLPVHYMKQYLEWAPRASGKGLVKIHDDVSVLEEAVRQEKGPPVNAAGNLIVETAQFFGLNITAGGRRCFLPMASTQLKKARRWITLATSEKVVRDNGSSFTPPLFYRTYNLSVADESNAEGDWMGWKVERGERLQDLDGWEELFKEAQAFRESISKGEVRGDLDRDAAPEADNNAAM